MINPDLIDHRALWRAAIRRMRSQKTVAKGNKAMDVNNKDSYCIIGCILAELGISSQGYNEDYGLFRSIWKVNTSYPVFSRSDRCKDRSGRAVADALVAEFGPNGPKKGAW